MKLRYLIIYILIFILLGTVICIRIARGDGAGVNQAKTTEINRLLISIEEDWDRVSAKDAELTETVDSLDYSVIDSDSKVLEFTRDDISTTVSAATTHYDIIRDVEVDGEIVGKLIIHNPSGEQQQARNKHYALLAAMMFAVILAMLVIYSFYIERRVISPFARLKKFATRIASGDLDSPLEMDKGHVFGEFTEAFDIMREELKSSREREEAAVRSRKELVAELSHDIKTPVASIKAMADVMSLTATDDDQRKVIASINGKADQIDNLISNLFHATLEELEQLEVNVEDLSSVDLVQMINEADYLNRVTEIDIKEVFIVGDRLRLNQIVTNIISNSYKYAGTDIKAISHIENDNVMALERNDNSQDEMGNIAKNSRKFLVVEFSDKGGGVPESELELITQKFKRGSNAEGKDGSGLGLYISNYLMNKMGGSLACRNNGEGLTVSLRIQM
ncbi:Signal transduction histidine kinase [Lachnospiraceae bacterium NE2001]|nr:Signal transduction histidine kinase [Lachnospiraceae bacterium NE2001]